ncbi:MAG: cytochrome c oxidase subunit I [Anaerolineae bacterium]
MATNVAALRRTATTNGWLSWVLTVDHKRIGILYLVTALVFFLVGGIEALLIRLQLGTPNNTLLNPDLYNQIFTMHGTTMVFLAVMPLNTAFANYIMPLQIGARDVAFPRLNALSYWMFLFGGLLLYSSFVFGGAPNAGWFGYAPLTERGVQTAVGSLAEATTHGIDFWILSLQLLGVSSLIGSLNFIVTILNLRAPGMRLTRMPLFTWGILVTSILLIFALPSVTVGLMLLLFDRYFGTSFYLANAKGDPLLWQHLFWFFGHPEVYIMIMPAFGIISEVIPTFSRKPIFGYSVMAYSMAAIGFLGFTVWAHHMFAVGLNPVADAAFALSSMLIAIPTGVKIFNWMGTLYRGSIRLTTSMLYALSFIGLFTIGGLSGVQLATVPVDWQVTDTYFVVAHFHYVLFAGAMMAEFAGLYYWFPKITGKFMNEKIGLINVTLVFIGLNLTFFPMHIVGLLGMPRRIYTYAAGQGWDTLNLLETIGAFIIALGVLVFLYNVCVGLRSKERAGNDPWDGQMLEWATSSPPPVYNFAKIPIVNSNRPFWDMKYGAAEGDKTPPSPAQTQPRPALKEEKTEAPHIHMPLPSYNPIIVAFGVAVIAVGVIFNLLIVPLGIVILFAGIIGWVREPA